MNTFRTVFILGLLVFISVPHDAKSQGSRVTDQHGTTFLMDVLPPTTQGKIMRSREIIDRGGTEGPLKVDRRNRYHISQNPNYTGGTNIGGSSEEELLVNQLLGVVLVPTPGDVRPSGWPGVEGVWHDFKDFPAEVGWALQNYIGKTVSLTSLDQMVKDVIVAYREADRPVVDVLLPEQDITSGVVQLVVIESKLGRIRIEGADIETEEYIRSQMRVRKGEVIRSSEVLHDLAWINRSPYRKVDLAYAPGYNFGETDIILKPYQTKTNSAFIGYEDSGTDILGNERFVAGFNMGEFFGDRTQALSYQFTSDWDLEHVRANTVVYSKDLPWRHNLTLLASFVDINGFVPQPFPIPAVETQGFNWQLSMRYNIPLKGIEMDGCPPLIGPFQRRRDMYFGFDFKSNESVLEFVGSPAFLPTLANNQVDIYQFAAGYKEVWQHPQGASQFDLAGIWSPGNAAPHNTDAVFNSARFGSESDYVYVTAAAEHQHRLMQDFSMRARVQGQLSNGNLQASEQFSAGGYDLVRGFDQRIVRGDEGIYTTVELYSPEISFARIFDWPYAHGPCTDSMRLLTFFDSAAVGNKDLLPGELESETIASVGVGMRYTYNDFFKLRVDYGKPIKTETKFPVDESGRFHIGATATF